MTVSSTTKRNSYTGNGSTTTFAYSFKIFDDDDITVILRTTATGTETVQTKTTHYSVTGVGNSSGGNVVFGSAPTSAQTVVLLRQTAQTQATDYTPNDPFPAASHEDALDKLTLMTQDQQDELDRSIKLSRTNTMTSTEFTVTATNRANKIFAFDSSGELSVTQEIGTFRGDWAASTSYAVRDLVKDTSTNNIFIVNEAHTSSGSQPLTTNANSAKYDLIVDAAAATTSASAAASSATAAASSASTASTQASNASSSASTASTQASNAASSATAAASSATAAAASATSAATALDNFDDIFLGAKSSDPSTDNDGDALTTGDIYFNTSSNTLRVFNGSSFQDASISTTATTAELNIMDGDTSASSTTVADADRVVFNDAGTMKQVAVTDLAAYFDDEITAMPNLVTTGALNSGSITSGFGAIDNGSSNITTTGVITGGTLEATADTSAGDNAAIGFTSAEGLILTGQGSTSDITFKNDADTTVFSIPTGTDDVLFPDDAKILMGAGSDLQIFHDGSNSFIDDAGTGVLSIRSNSISLGKYTGENLASFVADGAVTLFHDNSAKIATASTGVDITGGFTASDGCTITTADNSAQLTLISTDADANAGPKLLLTRDSGSPADSDSTGEISFNADDSAGNITEIAKIESSIIDVTNTEEDGRLIVRTITAGTATSRLDFTNTETVFNDSSIDVNFRVESDNTTHALFVEGSSGNVGIGDDDPGRMLHIKALGTSTAEQAALLMENEVGTTGEIKQGPASDNAMIFTENGSERMRVNTSGALLIGKQADSIANDGISLAGSATGGGHLTVTNTSNPPMSLNLKTNDGSILTFAKDGTVHGSISCFSSELAFISGNTGLYFDDASNNIIPLTSSGGVRDDVTDLGASNSRFDDIFATNGTIQTSDENEKQNIATLTSAEINAAKAISALFKTFKWKSKVTAKGDAARTHTGVVAQEVQAAMSAAGLDATKYAFWCSDTWWETSTEVAAVEAVEEKVDEDGNLVTRAVEAKDAYTHVDTYSTEDEAPEGATKRTRLGVRYPELLAFIGAATEQRLTDIETRLAALES